jgi:Leucine-rich repeat (LRR) protein
MQVLDLGSNYIEDSSVEPLSESLCLLTNLKTLNLQNNKLVTTQSLNPKMVPIQSLKP